MANSSEIRILPMIANVAVGVMLAVGGIWALQGGGDFGCQAIKSIFSGNMAKNLALVFGGIELLSGIFMILQLFIGDRIGAFSRLLKLIVVIVWICAIVLSDFFGAKGLFNGGLNNFLSWAYTLASHLIILVALLITRS